MIFKILDCQAQQECHKNAIMMDENEKLQMENLSIREAMTNPTSCNCRGSAMLTNIPLEKQQLLLKNARMKDEVCLH